MAALLLGLSGCGWIFPPSQADYGTSHGYWPVDSGTFGDTDTDLDVDTDTDTDTDSDADSDTSDTGTL